MKHIVRTLLVAVALVVGFTMAARADNSAGRLPISIYTEPAGGIIHIDNQRIGPAPVTDWVVTPGKHKVSVYRQGMPMVVREITVTKATGQRFTINTTMCAKCSAKCTAACAKCADCKKMGKMCPKCTEACKQMCAKCPECQKMCGVKACPDCKDGKKCAKCSAAKHDCKDPKNCKNCKDAKNCKDGGDCSKTKK